MEYKEDREENSYLTPVYSASKISDDSEASDDNSYLTPVIAAYNSSDANDVLEDSSYLTSANSACISSDGTSVFYLSPVHSNVNCKHEENSAGDNTCSILFSSTNAISVPGCSFYEDLTNASQEDLEKASTGTQIENDGENHILDVQKSSKYAYEDFERTEHQYTALKPDAAEIPRNSSKRNDSQIVGSHDVNSSSTKYESMEGTQMFHQNDDTNHCNTIIEGTPIQLMEINEEDAEHTRTVVTPQNTWWWRKRRVFFFCTLLMVTSVVCACIAVMVITQAKPISQTEVKAATETDIIQVDLVDGWKKSEGRVEVSHNGETGSLCSDNFGDVEASVVCKMLGYNGPNAVAKPDGHYGSSTSRIVLGNLDCEGHEASIWLCQHATFGTSDCLQNQHAGVDCDPGNKASLNKSEIRLVGGSRPSEGRLELFHAGEWGTVCASNWDYREAVVVCSMLGYTGSVPRERGSNYYGPGSGRSWLGEVTCAGNETNIMDCRYSVNRNCDHFRDIGVDCQPEKNTHGALTSFPVAFLPGSKRDNYHLRLHSYNSVMLRVIVHGLFPTGTSYNITGGTSLVINPIKDIVHFNTGISSRSISLQADTPVTLIGELDTTKSYSDIFLALPLALLSTEYAINSAVPIKGYKSNFLVLGLEDDTVVQIALHPFDGIVSLDENIITVKLEAHQTYQYRQEDDLTGAIISSNKTIAVYAGVSYPAVGIPWFSGSSVQEQLIPTKFWTTKYIIPRLRNPWSIRIIVIQGNTDITLRYGNTSKSTYMQAGDTLSSLGFDGMTVCSSAASMSVMQFASGPLGSRAMISVLPLSTYTSRYVCYCKNGTFQGVRPCAVSIVVPTKFANGLRLDGDKITPKYTSVVSFPFENFTNFIAEVWEGLHVLKHINNDVTFGAVVFNDDPYSIFGHPCGIKSFS